MLNIQIHHKNASEAVRGDNVGVNVKRSTEDNMPNVIIMD